MKKWLLLSCLLLVSGCVTDGVRKEQVSMFVIKGDNPKLTHVSYQYKENKKKLQITEITQNIYRFTIPPIRFGGLFLLSAPPEHEEYLSFIDGKRQIQVMSLKKYKEQPKSEEGVYELSDLPK